ncbi:MAG TPA: putative toxin-antitoxin system toxin component, PIN family [Allosphingosinicella sp.]|nr:putative toxin-antitoxin system toxin component, PIN family [Allosphingosinicella sp.]
MRVVLDTNVLVSALLSPGGMPARIVRAWLDERFILVSHPLQLDELRAVTRRDRIRARLRPANAGRLVNQIARQALSPATLPRVERSPDPRDDFLLALCEAAGADWLATGDKEDLLTLERHGRTRIVTAARLAEALGLEG